MLAFVQAESSAYGSIAWRLPQRMPREVDIAGERLALGDDDDETLAVISNWRSAHSFPLRAIARTLTRMAMSSDSEALVAQRLKRLPSIQRKLQQSSTRLSQMQDVGGCRAILRDVASVDDLVSLYRTAHDRSELHSVKNYIEQPKTDGYRSAHLIYRYRSRSALAKPYDGFKIEIQNAVPATACLGHHRRNG
jgi:(p)ppGpp synthase/HD superfamily hydrolase